jgi:glycosyltransferase involved in cell wall biosynthesis
MENERTVKVAIIIPNLNGIDALPETIESILRTTRYANYRIIIVDGGSDDGTQHYLRYLEARYNHITVVYGKKEGATKAINEGLKLTQPDEDVILTQNDVVFPFLHSNCWLTRLVIIANSNLNIGAVCTLDALKWAGPSYFDGFPFAGTWCFYIPRRTIEKIGIFDEGFSPGPGDDIDYNFRIALEGQKLALADFAVDHHRTTEHGYDRGEEAEQVKATNAQYFRKKHGLEK